MRFVLFALVGCLTGDGSPECPVGAEGCACTSGGGCDGGAVCEADVCVAPDLLDRDAFNERFVDAACAAASRCNAPLLAEVFNCGGSVPPGVVDEVCEGFDPVAAQACLDADWVCDSAGGSNFAVPAPGCAAICQSEADTDTDADADSDSDADADTDTDADVFTWTVALRDGDQAPDNGFDADTLTVTVTSLDAFPSIVMWEYGWAPTEWGAAGWYGEDCNGIPQLGFDLCHLVAPDTTMVLSRVNTLPELVPGSTTLFAVDYPEASTPEATHVLYGYDANGDTIECFVKGADVSYYAFVNCDVYVD